jgi:hypothetical protein
MDSGPAARRSATADLRAIECRISGKPEIGAASRNDGE